MPRTDKFNITVFHGQNESVYTITDRAGYLIQTFRGPYQRHGMKWCERKQKYIHWEAKSDAKEKALAFIGYNGDGDTGETPQGKWYEYYQAGGASLPPAPAPTKRTSHPVAISQAHVAINRNLSPGAKAAMMAMKPKPTVKRKAHVGATNISARQGLR